MVACRIENRLRRRAWKRFSEDALSHEGGRNGGEYRKSLTHAFALVVAEEKCLIFTDRPADRGTKLVLVVLALLGSVKVVARVEQVVSQKLISATVITVGS